MYDIQKMYNESKVAEPEPEPEWWSRSLGIFAGAGAEVGILRPGSGSILKVYIHDKNL